MRLPKKKNDALEYTSHLSKRRHSVRLRAIY